MDERDRSIDTLSLSRIYGDALGGFRLQWSSDNRLALLSNDTICVLRPEVLISSKSSTGTTHGAFLSVTSLKDISISHLPPQWLQQDPPIGLNSRGPIRFSPAPVRDGVVTAMSVPSSLSICDDYISRIFSGSSDTHSSSIDPIKTPSGRFSAHSSLNVKKIDTPSSSRRSAAARKSKSISSGRRSVDALHDSAVDDGINDDDDQNGSIEILVNESVNCQSFSRKTNSDPSLGSPLKRRKTKRFSEEEETEPRKKRRAAENAAQLWRLAEAKDSVKIEDTNEDCTPAPTKSKKRRASSSVGASSLSIASSPCDTSSSSGTELQSSSSNVSEVSECGKKKVKSSKSSSKRSEKVTIKLEESEENKSPSIKCSYPLKSGVSYDPPFDESPNEFHELMVKHQRQRAINDSPLMLLSYYRRPKITSNRYYYSKSFNHFNNDH